MSDSVNFGDILSPGLNQTHEQLVTSGQLKELKHLVHHGRLYPRTWRQAGTGRTLLHVAAASNQVEVISYLVGESRMDINLQDEDGNTALHLAVVNGHTEATNTILIHKANSNICNNDRNPALHLAVKQGSQGLKVFSEFLKHPSVNVFVTGRSDQTTLHVIARTRNIDALKLLHEKILADNSCMKLFLRNKNGLTAFHLAAQVGSHEVLEFLLSKCGDYNLRSNELLESLSGESRAPLHYAIERAHIECIRILLKHGSDPTSMKGCHAPPLHLACSQGNLDILKIMVDARGLAILQSHDREGGTPLHSSTSSINSQELISYLVENGVAVNDVDDNRFTALTNAIQLGSIGAVEQLLGLGADPLVKDKWGNTALHRAVLGKRLEVFKAVMNSNAGLAMVSSADGHGSYPIHLALKLGVAEMVTSLMDMTTEIFRDEKGNNYVHLAALSSDERSLSHLLSMPDARCFINEVNNDGFTPLHYAAMGSSITAVRNLVDHGAVIHRSNSGLTPFMCACSKGNLKAAEYLYHTNKFQRDWVDHCGCTALHAAVEGGNHQLITFCLDEGMAITLNDYSMSFFDVILAQNNKELARVAVSHKRWAECIDISSPDKPHPILRILDQMPDIYGIILDNCFSKSPLNFNHPDYWEEFNFKCLDLYPERLCEDEADGTVTRSGAAGAIELTNLNRSDEYDAIHTQLHTESEVAVEDVMKVQQHRSEIAQRQRGHVLSRLWKRRELGEGSLMVVRKLVKLRYKSWLLHPVVSAYIRIKWIGFGMYVHFMTLLMHFLLALFFSVFVVAIAPAPQTITLPQNNTDTDSNSLSTGAEVLLFISLVLAVLSLLLFAREVYVQGLGLIVHFTTEFHTWSIFISAINIIIFLVSILVGGLEGALWNAGAIGAFFAWATCTFSLQFIGALNMGVYILMIMSTTRLVLKVLLIFMVFIFAFTFAFYILVGSIEELQYNTIGLSLYSNLHAIIAVSDYLGFASFETDGRIRFSVLVFILLVALIVMLPVVFINVLIGLAVGDIAKIQREAIISRKSVELRALASLDTSLVPKCVRRAICKRHYKFYPNRLQYGRFLAKFFHQTFDLADDASVSPGNDHTDLKELRQEFAREREFYQKSIDQLQERVKLLAADQTQRLNRLEAMLAKGITLPNTQDV